MNIKTVCMETPLGDVTISGGPDIVEEIVKRCNAHADLLAALQAHQAVGEHVATCLQCGDSAPCYTYNGLARKADELTKSALAKVEEAQ